MDLEAERRLIEEIRQGKQESFRTLVDPLIAKSYRTAYMILRSAALAEEAVQNALIESHSAIQNGKSFTNFQAWFGRVVAHRSLDIARKEHNYRLNMDIEGMEIEDRSVSPLDELVRKEQSERLLQSIMALVLPQRIVVGLYYFQDMKIEEIASLLDIKEGTVKSRLYHARIKLGGAFHNVQPPRSKEVTV